MPGMDGTGPAGSRGFGRGRGYGAGMGWRGCLRYSAANAAPSERRETLEARLAELERETEAIKKLLAGARKD